MPWRRRLARSMSQTTMTVDGTRHHAAWARGGRQLLSVILRSEASLLTNPSFSSSPQCLDVALYSRTCFTMAEESTNQTIAGNEQDAALEADTTQHGGHRRARSPDRTTTQRVIQEMSTKHHLDMPPEQLVALCAYLCAVLQWGYRINTSDMDGFVVRYPDFEAKLEEFERQQVRQDSPCFPAYHQWYLENRPLTLPDAGILNEQVLRAVWRENPYTFVQIEHRLRAVAREGLGGRKEEE